MTINRLGISAQSIAKLLCFAFSVVVVLCYDWLPPRQLQLFPAPTATLNIFSDAAVGGQTQTRWLDEQHTHFECSLVPSDETVFCGGSITWWDQQDLQLDFSLYQNLIIDMDYQGDSPNFIIFLRSRFQSGFVDLPDNATKNMSVVLQSMRLQNEVVIPLDQFRVPDWWVTQNQIPPSESLAQMDQVETLGVSVSAPYTYQPEQFRLNQIRLSGPYFSKEILYGALLIFWAVWLGLEGAFRYYRLRLRMLQDEKKLAELSALSKRYKMQSETDHLTGLSNREGLAQMLSSLQQRQEMDHYGVLIIDVDHFKELNDKHGHDVGDQVLEELGRLIKRNTRSSDLVSRWGGEEFVVLFRYNQLSDIHEFAEKIRLHIASSEFVQGTGVRLTVTIGAASLAGEVSFEHAFKQADLALYEGKRVGRNVVKLA